MATTKKYQFDRDLIPINLRHTQYVTLEDGSVTTYRLVEGSSQLELDKQHPNAKPVSLAIKTMIYETDKPHIQKFIESLSFYGRKVKEYDPEIKVRQTLDGAFEASAVITSIKSLEPKDIKAVGYYFYGNSSFRMTNSDIQLQLIFKAQENPKEVSDAIDKAANGEYLFVASAFAMKAIKTDDAGNRVVWGDNDDSLIINVPKGKDALEEMVAYLKTTEGKVVKQEIGHKLNNTVKEKVEEAVSEIADAETTKRPRGFQKKENPNS